MKKTVLAAIVIAFFLLLFPKPISAYYEQGTGGGVAGGSEQEVFEEKVYGDDAIQNASHINLTQGNSIVALTHRIIGCVTEECKAQLQANNRGAVGSFANLTGNMYTNPPASGHDYIASLKNRLNLAKPAYARDAGFIGLRPILPLWQVARNIAYIFFTMIFVFIGFAIMLRVKISPQATITIQNAIPQIVITLILVTFSYAIAGFLIDLSYLVSGIGMNLIPSPEGNLSWWEKLAPISSNPGPGKFSFRFWFRGHEIIQSLKTVLSPATYLSQSWDGPVEQVIDQIVENIGPLAPLTAFVLSLILLFVFFKIFINLVVCYVKIIIHIISAPLQLMLGAIPGKNTFGGWIKNIAQNLLPFPVIIIMLKITDLLNHTASGVWSPPIIGAGEIGPGKYIPAILSFGMLVLMAQVPDMIKGIFAGEAFPYGQAFGQAMSAPYRRTAQGLNWTAQTGETIERAMGTKEQQGWAARASSEIKGVFGIREEEGRSKFSSDTETTGDQSKEAQKKRAEEGHPAKTRGI